MEQTYAQALWSMVERGTAPHAAVQALRKNLEVQGREALLPRIGRALERLVARKGARDTVVLTVARDGDLKKAEHEAKAALAELGVKVHDLKTRVDDSLIGGWRLEGKEMLVDASYKKQLLDMYSRVAQA